MPDNVLIAVLGMLGVYLALGWAFKAAQWRTLQRQYHAMIAGRRDDCAAVPSEQGPGPGSRTAAQQVLPAAHCVKPVNHYALGPATLADAA